MRHVTLLIVLFAGATELRAQRPDIQATFEGIVLVNGFHTSRSVNNSDVPQFVLPAGDGAALGATVRQTRVTLTATAPELLGGQLTGVLDADFFGGQQPSTGGRTFPLPRIRRAFAELAGRRFAVLVGQESPPIASVSPVSLASSGFPAFAGAGNLWLWIPQVRGSVELARAGTTRAGLELAMLAPVSGEPQTPFTTQPDAAERSGRPYLQSRMRAFWGAGDMQGEAGLGGHYGWLRREDGSLAETKAFAASAIVPVSPRLEVRGEAFAGEALAGLGGGGIGQGLDAAGNPIRTRGGWAQIVARPVADLEVGLGAGIDDPDDDDVAADGRLRNRAVAAQLTWRHAPIVVGLELRRLETDYAGGRRGATHVNLAAGWEFGP